jgi:hypothetical protein
MPRSAIGLFLAATLAPTALPALPALAGPIDPPPGPVAPTMKTLAEVEPRIPINAQTCPGDGDSLFRIAQSGSYYLAGNVAGVAGKHGIEVAVGGVTIDLGGFELRGVPGSLDGIVCPVPNTDSVSVRNGTVAAWGEDGVDLNNSGDGVIAGMVCTGNGAFGIRANGGVIVEGCTANDNTGAGIACYNGGAVRNCAARSNDDVGITVTGGVLVSGCTTTVNTSHGISATFNCRIVDNLSAGNGLGGTGSGIYLWVGNHCEGNTVEGNDVGVQAASTGNFIVRNSARSNTAHFQTAGTQTIGPIITATGTIATTNPWANFAY